LSQKPTNKSASLFHTFGELMDINPYLSLQAKVLPFRLEVDISRHAA
jgi:hypothetical protein